MKAVVARPPRNAQTVTVPGEEMVMAVPALATFWTPASRTMMARAAPKAAPWLTPRVEAEARGLCSTFCITQPDRARAAPTTEAVTTRGSRTRKTMVSHWSVPCPKNVASTCPSDSPEEPVVREKSTSSTRITSSTARVSHFRRRNRS